MVVKKTSVDSHYQWDESEITIRTSAITLPKQALSDKEVCGGSQTTN